MITCDNAQRRLNALADNELGPWAAAGIRRRLKVCEACRADYLSIQTVSQRFRGWREAAVPEHLSTRIANAVVANNVEVSQPTPASATRWHWQPFAALAGIAAVCAFAFTLLSSSIFRPTVAFAEVRQAMGSISAVSWTQAETRYDSQGRLTLRRNVDLWVRRDPPAVAEHDSPSIVAQAPNGEYAGAAERLYDSHGWINHHVGQGIYYTHPPLDIVRRVRGTIDGLTTSAANGTPWTGERATLSGRPVLVYRSHIHLLADASQPTRRTIYGEDTVWADPDTRRIIRRHSDITFGPTRVRADSGRRPWIDLPAERIVQDSSGFTYNQPAPQGVFTLNPPPDAKVTDDDGQGDKTLVAPPTGATE